MRLICLIVSFSFLLVGVALLMIVMDSVVDVLQVVCFVDEGYRRKHFKQKLVFDLLLDSKVRSCQVSHILYHRENLLIIIRFSKILVIPDDNINDLVVELVEVRFDMIQQLLGLSFGDGIF